jgi:hypothetical protein
VRVARARQDRDEAQAVEEEGQGHAEPRDEQAGDGGPDDARPVEDQRVERDGIGQVGPPDEIRDVGLTRRDVDGPAQAVDRGQHRHVPVAHLAAPDEPGQHERLRHHRGLGQQDDAPRGESVAQGAAHR